MPVCPCCARAARLGASPACAALTSADSPRLPAGRRCEPIHMQHFPFMHSCTAGRRCEPIHLQHLPFMQSCTAGRRCEPIHLQYLPFTHNHTTGRRCEPIHMQRLPFMHSHTTGRGVSPSTCSISPSCTVAQIDKTATVASKGPGFCRASAAEPRRHLCKSLSSASHSMLSPCCCPEPGFFCTAGTYQLS